MGDVPSRADEDTLRELRHWKRVARRYQRYLARNVWSADNWFRYGFALQESGELNSAAHAYAVALSLGADTSSDAHLQAGHLHEAQGDTQKAVQAYKLALQLNPENLDAADGLRVLSISEEEATAIIERGKEDRRCIGLHPSDRVLAAKFRGGPAIRRKWGTAFAAVIIMFCLVWGGTSMLIGPPLATAEDAYRNARAEVQRLTGVENVEAEVAARKAAEGKARDEAAARRSTEQKLAAEDARLKAEEARKAAEGKPKSAAELREQAEKTEGALALSERDRKKVQVALNSLGHEMPTVTGYFGPRTRAMITAWQKTQGLPETGFLDASQLAALQEQATPAQRADEAKLDARQQAERAEAGLNLSEQDRKRVQAALNSLGHEMPTVTGYFGPRTRAMITAWQKAQGLPETGYLTEVQLAALRQQAAPEIRPAQTTPKEN
jgi:peptidoglycan hydrolase-like protein with peptidoglycan-binding domain